MQEITTLGKVVSISLDVISRQTGSKVKTAQAQLKIQRSNEGVLSLLAACEEGMFEAHFNASKLRRSKVKSDLTSENWDTITAYVFNSDFSQKNAPPSGYENVVLAGRLSSSEEYDPETGELVGDELSNTPPDMDISVRTQGVLSVEYGSLTLQFKEMEELSDSERRKLDLLTWISDMAKQFEYLQSELLKKNQDLEEFKTALVQKEQAVEEMKCDYNTILRDVEDRFFQVLQSKKRKIAELEGHREETFDQLNVSYKEKQKSNLKILKLEDIIVGKEDRKYGERRIKRARKSTRKRTEIPVGEIKGEVKEESLPAEIKNEETEGLFIDDGDGEKEDNETNMDVENTPDSNTQEMDIGTASKSPEIDSEPELELESDQDSTDYSESDQGEGHVPADDSPNDARDEEDENETEYSDQ